jgi:uncharacterized protein YhfF
MTAQSVEHYWQSYLATLPADSPIRQVAYLVDRFGDTPELRESLSALILDGVKTATCSALWEWEAEDLALPRAGQFTVVLGAEEQPVCILETMEVQVRPFGEVDAGFAAAEGEGDRSLEYWRQAHWRFFTRSLSKIGRVPTEEMPLVCERFRLVYR